ncbi:hypothetical protein [Kineococcus sp. SYSU DK006]|uniref:hypothetical protein n=1 Tax=Kineococcus sp. SYSU DK006 TaxID=3383127 RepID=UPI003D7C7136
MTGDDLEEDTMAAHHTTHPLPEPASQAPLGTDGLTDEERSERAERYARTAATAPTREQLDAQRARILARRVSRHSA